ncbi:MAG: hypothetical protein MJK14_28765 [Rivularia sp. ALOHA_DT_140]|nr:hypothetical protein [Rivularia sp. ALOHA_DT_140]
MIKELVDEINRFEAIISEWDESQRCVAEGLKRAIEDLQRRKKLGGRRKKV